MFFSGPVSLSKKGGRWYLGFLPLVKLSALVLLDLALLVSTVVQRKVQCTSETLRVLLKCRVWVSRSRWDLGSCLLTGSQVMLKLLVCEPLLVTRIYMMHRDKGGKTSSLSSLGNISICFPPRAMILDDFLLQITAACLLFPSYTTQNWGFKKTECIHTEHKSLCQEGNDRAYQERCVPVMSAIPSMLKYEINEVEFNFRVYKFVMCSSFLLPFCMAGWSWLTCFVRRAALEFWLNQVLSPSPSSCSDEKEMLLVFEGSLLEVCISFAFLGGRFLGDFSKLDCKLASQQRAHCPSATAPEQFLLSWGWLLSPLGLSGLLEDQKWALAKRGDEDYCKGENQIKSFPIWISDF